MNLVYKNERKLYRILAVLSAIFWIALIAGTVGMVFIWLLFGFLIYLFAQSAFIAYVKGTGIRVGSDQLPEFHEQYLSCCARLEMSETPEFYVLNSNGILNAMATKFLRKKYVILYSCVIDALEKYPSAISFYMGHELAHIKRGHLDWPVFIWPASLLPVVGAAYSRAREYTCDLHGLHCCGEVKEAAFALSVLAVGPEYWSKVNIKEYVGQCRETGGFWMSFHEYIGDYPWLCKRVKHVVDSAEGKVPDFPRRSIFAFILSLFVPRLGTGGGAGGLISVMIVVAVIGILAAIALPAYQDYSVRAKVTQANVLVQQVKLAAEPYIIENRGLPDDLSTINLPENLSNAVVSSIEVTDDGFVFHTAGAPQLEEQTLVYTPYMGEDGKVQWDCTGGSLPPKYRSKECRQ